MITDRSTASSVRVVRPYMITSQMRTIGFNAFYNDLSASTRLSQIRAMPHAFPPKLLYPFACAIYIPIPLDWVCVNRDEFIVREMAQ